MMFDTLSSEFLATLSEKERVCIDLLQSRRYTHKQIQKKLYYATYEGYLKMLRKLRQKTVEQLSKGQKKQGVL